MASHTDFFNVINCNFFSIVGGFYNSCFIKPFLPIIQFNRRIIRQKHFVFCWYGNVNICWGLGRYFIQPPCRKKTNYRLRCYSACFIPTGFFDKINMMIQTTLYLNHFFGFQQSFQLIVKRSISTDKFLMSNTLCSSQISHLLFSLRLVLHKNTENNYYYRVFV